MLFHPKEDLDNLHFSDGEKVCIVAQTTYNINYFEELVEILRKECMILLL